MKIYQVHSNIMLGDVRLTYNNHGILVCWEAVDQLTPATVELRSTLLLSEALFFETAKKHNLKFFEVNRKVTFDMIWERYAYKVDKALALAEWNKLTEEERVAAYDFVPFYFAQLKANGGLAKKYLVRYLKHKPWVQ